MPTAALIGGSLLGAAASRSASKRQAKAVEKGTDAQQQAVREAQQYTREAATQAREDAMRLFGQQEQNVRAGIQSGLDLYGQTIPAQFEQQRAGNLAAQQMLSGALPQMNQAILGGPIDYSQFQPSQAPQVDTSMFNVQMPEYIPVGGAPQTPDLATTGPQNFLGGIPYRGIPGGLFGNNQFGGFRLDPSNISRRTF